MKEGNGVKNIVIKELAKKWPADVTELHARVLQHRPEVTYHAVYKAVAELSTKKIIRKDGKKYSINSDWIENIDNAIEGIKNSYLFTKSLFLPSMKDFVQEGETKTFIFESLEKADKYKKRLQWEYLMSKEEKKPYCAIMQHLRAPLFVAERSLSIMSISQKAKSEAFVVVSKNTHIDSWCADYYRNEFIKVQTGVSVAESCETAVMGDIILQTYIPDELRKKFDEMYAKYKDISEINITEFFSIYRKNTEIKVVVIKSNAIAQQLRSQILSNFKRDRLAIFDVNGTLVDGFLLKMFMDYLNTVQEINQEHFNAITLLRESEKKGRLTHEKYIEKTLDIYAQAIKGRDAKKTESLANDFIDSGMFTLLPFSKKLFNRMNSYCTTIAITKTPKEIMLAFRKILPFDYLLTSELEIKNGRYTGKYLRRLSTYLEKKIALKNFGEKLKSHEIHVGFGNRKEDLAFLEKAKFKIWIKSYESDKIRKQKNMIVFNIQDNIDKLTEAILKGD